MKSTVKNFVGRGGSLAQPEVIENGLPLSGKSGFSIDPIMSLRAMITVPVGKISRYQFLSPDIAPAGKK